MTNEIFFYIFYSIIQGITEFIPISSSGHLNILEFIYFKSEGRNFFYETTAHFASLLALLLYLYKNNHFEINNIRYNFLPISIATIPAVIVGLILISLEIDIISLNLIGITSIVGGLMLYFSDKKKFQIIKIDNKALKFFFAGLFQCLAFIPGFSRSGSCIIAFRLLGYDRKISSVYSLYLGIPIIAMSFLSNILSIEVLIFDLNILIIFFVTFIIAYLTLFFFIRFINSLSFTPFVIYRVFLGIIIFCLF